MTEPLTPPDCDLRGMEWMPLYGDRLFASNTWLKASPEAKLAALALWWASWKQKPAASLEDDDTVLAGLAGYGMAPKAWKAVREQALRGWVKCDDGRLYHPVVAELAREAWDRRVKERDRKAKWRQGRDGSETGTETGTGPTQSEDGDVAVRVETEKTGQDRTGKEEEKDAPSTASQSRPPRPAAVDRDFEDFWAAYPRKVGKDDALKAWKKATKRAPVEQIAAGLNAAQWPPDKQFIPHPATWLNQGRWQDEPADAAPEPSGKLDWLREYDFSPTDPVQ